LMIGLRSHRSPTDNWMGAGESCNLQANLDCPKRISDYLLIQHNLA